MVVDIQVAEVVDIPEEVTTKATWQVAVNEVKTEAKRACQGGRALFYRKLKVQDDKVRFKVPRWQDSRCSYGSVLTLLCF